MTCKYVLINTSWIFMLHLCNIESTMHVPKQPEQNDTATKIAAWQQKIVSWQTSWHGPGKDLGEQNKQPAASANLVAYYQTHKHQLSRAKTLTHAAANTYLGEVKLCFSRKISISKDPQSVQRWRDAKQDRENPLPCKSTGLRLILIWLQQEEEVAASCSSYLISSAAAQVWEEGEGWSLYTFNQGNSTCFARGALFGK